MAENAQTTTSVTENPTDYKALYEEAVKRAENAEAERDKQKGLKDTYAKENAEYKRKEAAQLSEEEKRALEIQELIERATNAEKQVADMQHRQSGLENGFTVDEVEKLVGTGVDFKVLKDIISARVDEAVKSALAEATASSTANGMAGRGSAGGANSTEKTDYQKYVESMQKPINEVKFN